MYVARLYGAIGEITIEPSPGSDLLTVEGLSPIACREVRARCLDVLTPWAPWRTPSKQPSWRPLRAVLPADAVGYDLPLAVAVLEAQGVVPMGARARSLLMADLALNGRPHPCRSVLPAVLAAAGLGLDCVVLSQRNAQEALLSEGIALATAPDLADVVAWAQGGSLPTPEVAWPRPNEYLSILDIRGMPEVVAEFRDAALKGDNVLLVGPPWAGKTMLARRMIGLRRDLSGADLVEVNAVHSVAGMLVKDGPLYSRPFRAPHYTCSEAGLVGGGGRPGEVSLAHLGVLFLDELSQFRRSALEAVARAVHGKVAVQARGRDDVLTFPADCQIIGAMNPCPCGRGDEECRCTVEEKERYWTRALPFLPLFQRVIHVPRVPLAALAAERTNPR